MAIGADQGHISVRQHNRAQHAAAVVARVRQSAGAIIIAQRKIDVRHLILPNHEAMTALVNHPVEAVGKRTPT
jgi:predicted TPR repeat methyltransferase